MSPRLRSALACALWLLLCLGLTGTSAGPASAQAVRVTELSVTGNQRINQETILSVVTTKVGDEASLERLERDRQAIFNLGWFRLVTVAPQRVGTGVRVVFVVTEYPVVQQVLIEGTTLFTEEQVRAVIEEGPPGDAKGTTAGQLFNQQVWAEDVARVTKLYTEKGYQVGIIDNTDQPDFLDKGILRVFVQELRVGRLELKWPTREVKDKAGKVIATEESHKTKEYVVLRELSQRPGALYNLQQLQKDYRALANLGFFETINPKQMPSEDLTVSIVWELTEKRTGQVSVGAGYSPRQRIIGRAELADQNFRGKGQAISISGEMGTWGGDGAPSVEFQFFEPWLTEDRTSMTVSLYNKLIWRFTRALQNNLSSNQRYFERRFGGQVSFGRPFQWPVTLGLRLDDVSTDDIRQNSRFPQQDGTVIAGNISRIWNTRDYATSPTEGHFLRLSSELGHVSLSESNADTFDASFFGKYIADYRKYIRLRPIKATKEPEREQESKKVPVLALRAMAGTVTGKVPFFEQFFMGGAETLRGYLEDRFWGNTMYLASVEYRRPLLSKIVGVVFADVGDAFGSQSIFQFRGKNLRTDFEQHRGIRPYGSVGLGLRVETPIGPIRFDFGYGEEGGRTHFSIGHAF